MKKTGDWISAQNLPSDITVHAGGADFSLHRLPLISKCGLIKKLLTETNETKPQSIHLPEIPGGSKAFELAVKFCYGINSEITTENVAILRCASEFLEMTEEISAGNLQSKTEAFLQQLVLMSITGAVTVLHQAEELLPMAENVKLMSRCIDAIAYLGCSNGQPSFSSSSSSSSSFSRGDHRSQESFSSSSVGHSRGVIDWWAEELIVLKIDTFQRVLMALKSRGFKQHAVGPILMLYAQKSLRGLDIFGRGRKKIEPKQEHEKRVVLETIVSLLPTERNTMPVSFLSTLLRASLYLETTVACRIDLEKRIGMQLAHAALDDLLIPSFSFDGDILFDVDTIQRIFINYLEHESHNSSHFEYNTDDDYSPPPRRDVERVGRLMESYLAEIASDPKLEITKFISFAELIPEQAKVTEDDMYRAVDIYLKAHQSLTEAERKKVCSLMDFQRLSREACAHAAQNDRLPVQTVVQVLYSEQQRIRDSMTPASFVGGDSPAPSHRSGSNSSYQDSADEFSQLRRENDNLKLELVKMRMQVKEDGKPPISRMPSTGKPPLPKKSFIHSVSKKLGQINAFLRSDTEKSLSKAPKSRRHSIS
ncbi:BTB/POZ domain-containing protein [Platanthera zijinensis]|uniref:BTB/POZ domain-containing protein n=1 Tax=Platanthera zijinensis TaxID=2320716 RepID=A0AAP0BE44_9ASPA